MTDEQKAAYVNAQTALLNAEIAMMVAANMQRQAIGASMAYGEEAFAKVIKEYESVLAHNPLIGLFHNH